MTGSILPITLFKFALIPSDLTSGLIGSVIPVCFLIIVLIIYFKQFLYLFLKNNDNLKFDKICIVSCFFITLFPFVPAGNIFNNWMSIIFYLPIGFYLNYIKS